MKKDEKGMDEGRALPWFPELVKALNKLVMKSFFCHWGFSFRTHQTEQNNEKAKGLKIQGQFHKSTAIALMFLLSMPSSLSMRQEWTNWT